jgi:hypothetical protein
MAVDDGIDVGAGAQDLRVDRQLVRHRPLTEIARAVQVDLTDVGRPGEEEPLLLRPAAAHEHAVGTGAEADVAEHVLGEAAGAEHAAGVRDEQAASGRSGTLVHWSDPIGRI